MSPHLEIAHLQGFRRRRPCWSTYYQLGVELNKRMPAFRTWEQVGALLNVTKQNAYTQGVVALGKLAFHTAFAARKESNL
jgi:hypothetical protein